MSLFWFLMFIAYFVVPVLGVLGVLRPCTCYIATDTCLPIDSLSLASGLHYLWIKYLEISLNKKLNKLLENSNWVLKILKYVLWSKRHMSPYWFDLLFPRNSIKTNCIVHHHEVCPLFSSGGAQTFSGISLPKILKLFSVWSQIRFQANLIV